MVFMFVDVVGEEVFSDVGLTRVASALFLGAFGGSSGGSSAIALTSLLVFETTQMVLSFFLVMFIARSED
jgi:hypothetical protein